MKAPYDLMFYYEKIKAGQDVKLRPYPWLPETDIGDKIFAFLKAHVDRSKEILEFGSGGSTIWFARNAASVLAFEIDPFFHKLVNNEISRRRLTKRAEVVLNPDYPKNYKWGDRRFDFVLNDGINRQECAKTAVLLLKPGGLVMCRDGDRTPIKRERKIYETNGMKYIPIIPGIRAAWRKPK